MFISPLLRRVHATISKVLVKVQPYQKKSITNAIFESRSGIRKNISMKIKVVRNGDSIERSSDFMI
jgi:hypothetical protein